MIKLLLVEVAIIAMLQATTQSISFDSVKPYVDTFQTKINIPDEFQFHSVSQVKSNNISAYLFRYQKNKNETLNGEHFSFLISKNERQILGFTNMSKKYSDTNLLSKNDTEVIAKKFLAKVDKPLSEELRNLWINRHDEKILDDVSKATTIVGMKYKCYLSAQDDYAWVIVGYDGTVITYERNIKWNIEESYRVTEKWLHDDWVKKNSDMLKKSL